MLFPEDPFVGALHATFFFRGNQLCVRDEGTASGTFVRIHGSEPIVPGVQFAAGDRLLRYEGPVASPPASQGEPLVYGAPTPSRLFAVEELLQGGRPGRACARPGPVLSIGRSGCDLSFPVDPTLAARHCELVFDEGAATLRDGGGPEGTMVRLAPGGERPLVPGDTVRLGMQVLRVESVAG